MIHKCTIYGERCSGTNYLEQLLIQNFDIKVHWHYGYKHFFGFSDLSNSDDTLFIAIVRNEIEWINSLYRHRHLLPIHLTKNVNAYLNEEFYSEHENGIEIMEDRNIYTKERYKNIFELRHIKNKYLVEDMPTLVKNYLLITHEDLLNNFANTMNLIKGCNISVKTNIEFPLNVTIRANTYEPFKLSNDANTIPSNEIINKSNLYYEKILFGK